MCVCVNTYLWLVHIYICSKLYNSNTNKCIIQTQILAKVLKIKNFKNA